jgi:hypothetical protein
MTRAARAEQRPDRDQQQTAGETPRKAADARKERVPLGVPRSRLTVPQRAGYKRRWINDDGKGRLQQALEGGYTFVEDPKLQVGQDKLADRPDSRVSRIVGRGENGKPLRAFLMEIPSELYQEDQRAKQRALDEVDRAIRKGRLVTDGEEHRYVPERGIRVESEAIQVGSRDEEDNE